ncbi:MAG: hypothetical protein A2494_01745 [Candidatus Lloydbacteria bacterium RIFOXYC12_FULL_46_25]|uniref:Uncharacterized protein n=1 Tax=Candidatus Lloydbacteria bacterium RIFOXYC12_FULL_46_25 TaxID=1798670 RepID=A0A1G2E157_9BACT|nr:MAG: hypothetical protein A2494_01745 [Candidatus Lloydbacteria bacterium RIFOXYC12_FULL_46_25]
MDQNGELISIRRSFVSMFMRGMRARVSYELHFALFNLIYFLLPMFFVFVVVPLRIMDIISPEQFLFLMVTLGIVSTFIYLRIVYVDHIATRDCLRGIFNDYPSLRYDLHRSAKLQWADAE